jgi:hypothetical protein
MEESLMLLKGRLDGRQRNRLKRLLDMLYSPKELAEEVGFDKEQVYRVYVPLGCPHERDSRNHLLINGATFIEWYQQQYKKTHLSEGESFCKSCKKAVAIVDGKQQVKDKLTYILSLCPYCGRKLTKIIDCSRGRG